MVAHSRVNQQLEKWRQDLVNLTRRNTLLYFRHLKTSTLEVVEPGLPELAAGLANPSQTRWSIGLPASSEPDLAEEAAPLAGSNGPAVVVRKPDSPALLRSLKALERKASRNTWTKGCGFCT
jgi:hypothetical protein